MQLADVHPIGHVVGAQVTKPVSRQRRWQLARIAEGKCQVCGKPAVTVGYCRRHGKIKSARVLAAYYRRRRSLALVAAVLWP